MIAIRWTGKAVGTNKRHTISRTSGHIINTRAYRTFLEDLAYTIREAAPGIRFEKISVVISVSVSNSYDHHNLHKPIMDAIEKSGLLGNDKNILFISWLPPERHKRGEIDEIFLLISEVKT